MTALPTRAHFGQAGVTEANNQAAMGALYDAIAGLFGSDGTAKTALATVGALAANVVKKSAAYTVVAGDRGMVIICEGTSWTLDLLAIATAGKGFPLIVWSRASGTVTIDGNGSEKIKSAYATDQTNGDTTLALANGEACLLVAHDEGAGVVYWAAPLVAKRAVAGAYQPLTVAAASNAMTATLAAGATLQWSDGTSSALGAAISATLSNGSSLGTTNGVASRIWVVAAKNGGVSPELAFINTWDGSDIYSILPTDIITTTAEGGAGTADSAHTWYSTTARTSQAMAIVGYFESTQTTAGVWAAQPSKVQGFAAGMLLPGQAYPRKRTTSTAYLNAGSTVTPYDDTIPQVTEGNAVAALDTTMTARSALNLVQVDVSVNAQEDSNTADRITAHLHQDGGANAVAAGYGSAAASNTAPVPVLLRYVGIVGTAAATTFAVRVGLDQAYQIDVNGVGGGRKLGGAGASWMEVMEVQR